MAKVPILIVLLPQLLCTLLEVSGQQSPCYEYFTYIFDPATRQVMGQIQIPSAPKNVELHLKVTLSIAIELPTNYGGVLKVAQSKEEFVWMDQRDKPLLYHIHFPLPQPTPLLTGIWFNDQQYCSGPHATGQVVTSITLDHTLYRSSVLPHSPNSYNSPQQNLNINFQPNIFLSTPQPTVPVYTSTLHTRVQNSVCGINSPPNNSFQWPWLVAILQNVGSDYFQLRCTGSILTKKHVITVAYPLRTFTQTDGLIAYFGKEPFFWNRAGFKYREIACITLHPNYYSSSQSADYDLAILTLKTPIEFSFTSIPICLWYGSIDLQSVVNKTGYVVVWDKDEFGNLDLEELLLVQVPIVSQETCLWSHPAVSSAISNRTFCASMRDGSGSCVGAYGSGLMFYDPTTQRYQLRGIISRIPLRLDNNHWTCDFTQYVVFVDVAKHLSWIYQQISTEQQYYQQDPYYRRPL